jgi:hypothetical protein
MQSHMISRQELQTLQKNKKFSVVWVRVVFTKITLNLAFKSFIIQMTRNLNLESFEQ